MGASVTDTVAKAFAQSKGDRTDPGTNREKTLDRIGMFPILPDRNI